VGPFKCCDKIGINLSLQVGALGPEAQGPQWEVVAVVVIADEAAFIEDTHHHLPGPASVGLLPLNEEAGGVVHGGPILALAQHKPHEGPGGLGHMPFFALHPAPLACRTKMLRPASVFALFGEEEGDGALDGGVVGGKACGEEAQDGEPGAIGEAHGPTALEASVGALLALDEGGAFAQGLSNAFVGAEVLLCFGQTLEAGGGTFHIAMVHHNFAENLGGVEGLIPISPPF